jgi:hypothetical protein
VEVWAGAGLVRRLEERSGVDAGHGLGGGARRLEPVLASLSKET